MKKEGSSINSTTSFKLSGSIREQAKVESVVYLVVQAYGSLALEDNSEVGEAALLDRFSISCVCTSAF